MRDKSYSRVAGVCNFERSGWLAENETSPGELIRQLIRK